MKSFLPIWGVFSIVFVSACSFNSLVNIPSGAIERRPGQFSPQEVPSGAVVACENVPWKLDPNCRNADGSQQLRESCHRTAENFVALAISGGASRSAVFSAQVLFALQRYGILQQVDVISSVSGGSFTAALYALSCDNPPATCPPTVEGPDRTVWREDIVFPLLKRDLIFVGSETGSTPKILRDSGLRPTTAPTSWPKPFAIICSITHLWVEQASGCKI